MEFMRGRLGETERGSELTVYLQLEPGSLEYGLLKLIEASYDTPDCLAWQIQAYKQLAAEVADFNRAATGGIRDSHPEDYIRDRYRYSLNHFYERMAFSYAGRLAEIRPELALTDALAVEVASPGLCGLLLRSGSALSPIVFEHDLRRIYETVISGNLRHIIRDNEQRLAAVGLTKSRLQQYMQAVYGDTGSKLAMYSEQLDLLDWLAAYNNDMCKRVAERLLVR